MINTYMPSDARNCDQEYKDTLSQLQELLNTYSETHEVVISGDMNASVKRNRPRDKTLKAFLLDNKLTTTDKYPDDYTFLHHNQKSSTQIDYFFFQEAGHLNVENIVIAEHSPTNLSDHTLLTATIKTPLPCPTKQKQSINNIKYFITKPKWTKIDKHAYREKIREEVKNISSKQTTENKLDDITNILHKAGETAVPNYRKKKRVKTRGKRVWNKEISDASKRAKALFGQWKAAGRRGKQLKSDLNVQKKQLRKVQRQALTRCKNTHIEKIMSARETTQKPETN